MKRDLGYLEAYMSQRYAPDSKKTDRYLTILTLYGQQYYMWKNRTHSVRDRIVSISQPWVRPVVRGKAKAPVEFGAKLEASIDEKGYGRLESVSFDPFNESTSFMKAMDGYSPKTVK